MYSVSPIGNYTSGGAVIEFRDVTEEKKIEQERLNAILMNEQQSSQSVGSVVLTQLTLPSPNQRVRAA